MDGGDTPEDRDVHIVDLPDANSNTHVRRTLSFPPWLTSPQSPRQRRQRLVTFIALGGMALLIMLGSTPMVRNLASGLIARVTALPTPTPTPQVVRPLNPGNGGGTGRIAFTCLLPSHSTTTICLSALDGAGLRQFAHLPAGVCCPHWSPDGKRLAFSVMGRFPPLLRDIWVMNADGSGLVNLTHAPQQDNGEPFWSPDGKQLVFSALLGNTLTLYLMHADGSQKRPLLRGIEGGSPVWSPDGRKIAFISQLSDTLTTIYVMNADGSAITRLTQVRGFYRSLVWSPDSKHLLYAYAPDSLSLTDVYMMNADGSQQVQLISHPSDIASYFPTAWSPDGTKILFARVYMTDGHLGETTVTVWVMNADGSGQTPLPLQIQAEGDAVWQP